MTLKYKYPFLALVAFSNIRALANAKPPGKSAITHEGVIKAIIRCGVHCNIAEQAHLPELAMIASTKIQDGLHG
jgi:hypothetical protein